MAAATFGDLPVELLIMIAEFCDRDSGSQDICNLRLMSRPAADNLSPLLVKDRVLDIHLDYQGLVDLESLIANFEMLVSRIENISLGIRKICHVPFILEKGIDVSAGSIIVPVEVTYARDVKPDTNIDKERQAIRKFATNLRSACSPFGFCRDSSVEALWREGFRFHESVHMKGCAMLGRHKDFTPERDIVERIIKLLHHFPRLKSIASNEAVQHRMLIFRDRSGKEVDRLVVRDQARGATPHGLPQADCTCKAHRGAPVDGQGTCKSVKSMGKYLVDDFVSIRTAMIEHHDDPSRSGLFHKLKSFSIKFPITDRGEVGTIGTEQTNALVEFLLTCKNLEDLSLITDSKQKPPNSTVNSITFVLEQLRQKYWTPPLRRLSVSCIDRVNKDAMGFLRAHAKSLKDHKIRSSKSKGVAWIRNTLGEIRSVGDVAEYDWSERDAAEI